VIAEAPATQAYQQVRPYLFSVAYRMTGSASDAEDLVHDAWIRYLDAGSPVVDSLRAYLTTIVSRLSLDYLKSARVRREQYAGTWMPEPVLTGSLLGDPAATAERREDISIAVLVLLERLTPEQRVVYVLREALGLPYDEIAGHVGKSPAACRQIFHRAQGRLDGDRRAVIAPEPEHRELVERFIEIVRAGDIPRIAALLTEDVTLVGDSGPGRPAPQRPISGITEVSRVLSGLARTGLAGGRLRVSVVDVNGAPAVIGVDDDRLDIVVALDIRDGGIAGIRGMRDPRKLAHLARALGLPAPRD
jgi:RNA polymerase sigma-70 factor (ECF subfamily)